MLNATVLGRNASAVPPSGQTCHPHFIFFGLARLQWLWNCTQDMLAWIPNDSKKKARHRPRPLDDETGNYWLVNELRTGNPNAAFEFCDLYGPRINRWVWRLLGGDDDHDEVVQQVYVGLFSSLPRLRDPDTLDAFVNSVTIRTVRKEIRRRKYRRLFLGTPAEYEDDIADMARPMKDVHIRAFYRILDDLSADERTVFVLKHFEGLTMEEIAAASGFSVRTAKRRLYRGMARIKEKMMKETVLITLLEEF